VRPVVRRHFNLITKDTIALLQRPFPFAADGRISAPVLLTGIGPSQRERLLTHITSRCGGEGTPPVDELRLHPGG